MTQPDKQAIADAERAWTNYKRPNKLEYRPNRTLFIDGYLASAKDIDAVRAERDKTKAELKDERERYDEMQELADMWSDRCNEARAEIAQLSAAPEVSEEAIEKARLALCAVTGCAWKRKEASAALQAALPHMRLQPLTAGDGPVKLVPGGDVGDYMSPDEIDAMLKEHPLPDTRAGVEGASASAPQMCACGKYLNQCSKDDHCGRRDPRASFAQQPDLEERLRAAEARADEAEEELERVEKVKNLFSDDLKRAEEKAERAEAELAKRREMPWGSWSAKDWEVLDRIPGDTFAATVDGSAFVPRTKWNIALRSEHAEDGPGIMVGDVQGSFHRIRAALPHLPSSNAKAIEVVEFELARNKKNHFATGDRIWEGRVAQCNDILAALRAEEPRA